MSAMLETYDMPMLDYQNDLDIQMHPSSDQWFPDEAQMEEDAPGVVMKPENYSPPKAEGTSQMKTDNYSQNKVGVTIEVDMEPFSEHQNVEYDMEDDEDIHHSGGENLDVEVYDVSQAQSPFMAPGDIVQDEPSNFIGSFDHTDTASLSHKASPIISHASGLAPLDPQIVENTSLDNLPVANDGQVEPHDFQLDSGTEVEAQAEFSEPAVVQEPIVQSSETFLGSHSSEDPAADNALPTEITNILPESETVTVAPVVREDDAVDDNQVHNQDDQAEIEAPTISDNTLGDPHEISEGVYIDPPPPVLLSVASEDHFDCSFFNESPEWNTSSRSDGDSHQVGLVFLHHLPTLYYEPLLAVFDALREEQYVQSMFHLAESELVLDAVDLQLTISEDNIYAREVTLHDLNILHDVSGINGLLRMRLYASAPRFITRYQYLQDHVSRLNLEPAADIPLVEVNNEEEAPLEETQEVENHQHEESSTEEHILDSVNTTEPLADTYEQGNKDDGHNEGEFEAHTTGSFDLETDLPPLPTEDNDEDEVEEETPFLHDNLDISAPNNTASETEVEQVNRPSLSEQSVDAVVTLEALEAPNDDGHLYGEEENGEEGNGEEENQVEGEHTDHERREEENSAVLYPEHEYHEHAEEPAENEQERDEYYYPEDGTDSHGQEEQLDYVDEPDTTLETETLETPLADLAEFDDVHSNVVEDTADKTFVASGSIYEQATNEGETEGDHVSISHLNATEQENSSPEIYTAEEPGTTTTGTEIEISEGKRDPHFEDGTEFEDATFRESMMDPTLQEAYTWEDDLDGEGDPETPLEGDNEDAPSHSNHSSVTLSSKASKRSFDDFEFEEGYENEDGHWSPPSSPDPKRTRTH